MSRVEEIAEAIQRFSPDEFAMVAHKVLEIQQKRWAREMDADARSGKLKFSG